MTQAIDPGTQVFANQRYPVATGQVTARRCQATDDKIAFLHAFCEAHPLTEVSAATAAVYRAIVERLTTKRTRLDDTRSPRTFNLRKVALKQFLRAEVENCIARIQAAIRIGETATAEAKSVKACDYVRIHQIIAGQRLGEDRAPKASKRRTVGRYPHDWPARLYAAFRGSATYRLPVAVLALCGCRSAELVSGVVVESVAGGEIAVTIKGAKVIEKPDGKGHGQEWRRLKFQPSTPWALDLADAAVQAGGRIVIHVGSGKRLYDAVTEASERVFPRHRERLTPYCFRHAFASHLKSGRIGVESIAVALGHATDATQCTYGTARASRVGGDLPTEVTGARSIRMTKGTGRIPSNKTSPGG